MEGPSPGRVCAALVNSSKLWELKGLKDAGILTQKQFEGQVHETLTPGDAPTVVPPIKKRAHASLLRTASSDPKQSSLFSAGFWVEKTTKEGDVVRIDGDMRPITSPHCHA